MTDRDRLIKLMKWFALECGKPNCKRNERDCRIHAFEQFADYFLANGVIVPPCKVGDKVWDLHQRYNGTFVIQEGKISMLQQKADKSFKLRITANSSVWDFTPNEIGTRYFLTKEEAEEKLKELNIK